MRYFYLDFNYSSLFSVYIGISVRDWISDARLYLGVVTFFGITLCFSISKYKSGIWDKCCKSYVIVVNSWFRTHFRDESEGANGPDWITAYMTFCAPLILAELPGPCKLNRLSRCVCMVRGPLILVEWSLIAETSFWEPTIRSDWLGAAALDCSFLL